jgi:hypothetical protein
MKLRALNAALCLAAGLAFGPSHALADTVEELATAIKDRFESGTGYKEGKLGLDWCFNVETEPRYTYWYYEFDGKLEAKRIRHTARIQAIYKDNNMSKYASVFLGLHIDKDPSYPLFDLNSPSIAQLEKIVRASPMGPPAKRGAAGSGLQEPDQNQTKCMRFADFLGAYVLPFTHLEPQNVGNPDTDQGSEKSPRHWIFAGRPHYVYGIASYKVKMKYRGGDVGDAYLVVGFGGGGGP